MMSVGCHPLYIIYIIKIEHNGIYNLFYGSDKTKDALADGYQQAGKLSDLTSETNK